MIETARFLLSDEALAAAGALHRGESTPHLALLEKPNLAKGGQLTPALALAIGTLSEPQVSIAITRMRPGDTGLASMVLAGDGVGGFAVHGGTSSEHDIVWLGSPEDAALQVGAFLDLTEPPYPGDRSSSPLSAPAWAALNAIADAVRAGRLRSQLERAPRAESFAVDVGEVLRAYADGCLGSDSRWAVSMARLMSVPEMEFGDQDVLAGVTFLAAIDWLSEDAASLTAPGMLAANDIATAITWGQVVVRYADERLSPRWLLSGRTPLGAWTLARQPASDLFDFTRVDPGTALLQFVRLLEAPPAPEPAPAAPAVAVAAEWQAFCTSCGRERRPGSRFCGSCGRAFG